MRTVPPKVRATLAFASVVPEIDAVCSPALMTSSPATLEIEGAFGATVSTVRLRVPASEVLPAASVALADRVSGPWPIAVMSSDVSV